MDRQSVTIFSDSQAALGSLAALKVSDKTVADCIEKLNLIAIDREVTLKWVKAHVGHTWNEFADEQAKLGTSNTDNKVDIPPPYSWTKNLIGQATYNAWTRRWSNLEEARQTKIWFP